MRNTQPTNTGRVFIRRAFGQTARVLFAIAILVFSLTGSLTAATLWWDATNNPASPGPQDGNGNWSATANNTNWWDGTQNVAWNNANGDIAVFGSGDPTAPTAGYTVTLTNNNLVLGGIIFSNQTTGATSGGTYTIATSAGNTNLILTGSPASIILASTHATPNNVSPGNETISANIIATNGLSVTSASTFANLICVLGGTSNAIIGSLNIGNPGNASYTTGYLWTIVSAAPAGLNGLTNVNVYSNAMVRFTMNGNIWSTWPQKVTISGDGCAADVTAGATPKGALLFTGTAGTWGRPITLAGDSTIMVTFGTSDQTYTITNVISGTGRLRFSTDNAVANGSIRNHTFVLTNNTHAYVGDTWLDGRATVRLASGKNDYFPTSTVLRLGTSGSFTALNGYGRLALGDASGAVNQTIAGLTSDPGVSGSWIKGNNSASASVLTVNAATDYTYTAQLGDIASPGNQLALVKTGAGTLFLSGSNLCAGGYTVNNGTLQFGDGSSDYPISGPITNNAALTFATASVNSYGGVLSGSGLVTKTGSGWLTLAGANTYTGPTIVSAGKLTLLTSQQIGAGALLVTNAGAELEVKLSPGGPSLTNASASFDTATLDFNLNQGNPGATALLTVSAGVTNAGSTLVNILNYSSLAVGTFPLIHYGSYQSNALSSFNLGPLPGGTAFLTNDTVNHNISLVVTKFDGFIWTGATDNNWDTTTTNWSDITTLAPNVYGLGGFARFYDSGNNTAIQINSDPQPSSVIVSNNAKAYSFNGSMGIGGTAGLFKRGPGTLTVAVNNNNSGGTTIENGTVQVGDGSNDGTITAPITDNATLVYNVLNTTAASSISGTGTLTKTGLGQLSLGGGSSYSGATTVQQGQLHVTDSAALGATNSGTVVQSGGGVWVDVGGLNVPEPLTLSGSGASGEGALVMADFIGASTWSGPLTVVGDSLLTVKQSSSLTIASGILSTNRNLVFSADNTGFFLVSNTVSAKSVTLSNSGGLVFAGANPSITNFNVVNAVPNGTVPANSGLWARNNQSLGTNSIVTLTNSDYIGGTGARLGLDNNVTIPANVSLVAYCPGDGLGGLGGYRCTLSVLTSTTNTWNGPITIHGADPSLGITSLFMLNAGNSGTSGRLVVNGNISLLDGPVLLLPRGFGSGQFNGRLNLGTNDFAVTDGARWTVASTTNTWRETQLGSTTALLALGTNNALCVTAPVNFTQSGTWDLNGFNQQVAGLYGASGSVVNSSTNAASTLTISGTNNWTFGGALMQSAVAGAKSLGLIVTNSTVLALTSTNNSYSGLTVIANGATLALANNGTDDGTILVSPIKVQAGGIFDVSARSDAAFTISSSQVLSGNGTVNGSLTNNGTLSPGESIGKLTVNANVTMGVTGSTGMEVNNATATNDLLTVGGTLTYDGTLLITNVSGTLYTNNQVLKLFNATGGYAGSFANIVFPGVTTYDATQLNVNGTVKVVSVIPTTPTNITVSVSGGNMTLSWPVNYTGWRLEVQTNAATTGLNTNWSTYPGSTSVNSISIPINPANGSVFFRMAYP